jgi:hypothetical protein
MEASFNEPNYVQRGYFISSDPSCAIAFFDIAERERERERAQQFYDTTSEMKIVALNT